MGIVKRKNFWEPVEGEGSPDGFQKPEPLPSSARIRSFPNERAEVKVSLRKKFAKNRKKN